MSTTALKQLETLLQTRKLDGTLLRPWSQDTRPVSSSGILALDEALGGGWPRGEVSELVGSRSSGRTSVVYATLAAVTRRGGIAGLVDACDRFDPASAAAAGVALDRVLWARGPACTVEQARPALLDRALRQAIRACDQMVRAGGFDVIVLDVADLPAIFFRALPAATWLRLAHANEGRPAACVLVGGAPIGRSARGVTVRLESRPRWTGDSLQSRRLDGLRIDATFGRGRPGRDRASWDAGGGRPCAEPAGPPRRSLSGGGSCLPA